MKRKHWIGILPGTRHLFRGAIVVTVASAFVIASGFTLQIPAQPSGITIEGFVRDSAGHGVPDVSVQLTQQGASSVTDTKTNVQGSFAFSGLGPGTYLLIAEKSGQRTPETSISVSVHDVRRQVDLILGDRKPAQAAAPSHPSLSAMEFADKPNFTVAAVTDWTAAGGHGSDAVLRTSEALNRETATLKPVAAASTTAASSSNRGESEAALRADAASAPKDFNANHNLGEYYLHAGRYADAVPLLQNAYELAPANADNEYDLALALKGDSRFAQAREHVQKLMAVKETADLHRLTGELDEHRNDPLAAVREFQRAVREDPSEQNYFAWGSELLLHRAIWQARDVFAAGAKAYPTSARMLAALGAALFAGALYDEAAQRLCEASDLDPANPQPYLFMGKIEMAAPNPLPCVEQKLERFVNLQPQSALANYFYAMTFWKQHGQSTDPQTVEHVEGLLTKAVTIDPKCSDAWLQLGVLQSSQRDYQKAIGYYNKAIDVNPQFAEAHYRLGVAYDRVGEREKARLQFQLHDDLEKQQAAAVEGQRKEIKQFQVVIEGTPADPAPHD